LDDKLAGRIREINGPAPAPGTEVVKPGLFKGSAVGLNAKDIRAFLEWFLGPHLRLVKKAGNISGKLLDLKRERLAKFHVMCPDGPVPVAMSMLMRRLAGVASLFFSHHRDQGDS
jgi:hypothetical protein